MKKIALLAVLLAVLLTAVAHGDNVKMAMCKPNPAFDADGCFYGSTRSVEPVVLDLSAFEFTF